VHTNVHAVHNAASLNMQTADKWMDLNAALFRVNANTGYVLKPPLPITSVPTPVSLTVQVVSGQCLPAPESATDDILDPYVTLEVLGYSEDRNKQQTNWVHDNGWHVRVRIFACTGFNPEWHKSFDFKINYPQLAFLRFCVKDYSTTSQNEFVGEYTVLVAAIRQGREGVCERARTATRLCTFATAHRAPPHCRPHRNTIRSLQNATKLSVKRP
jgi:phosphatidylinositol phospholipase C delta